MCVHVTLVPSLETTGVQRRFTALRKGGKSVELGALALTTPANPESAMVAMPGEGQVA
jgi:hypothetical protein